MKTRYMGKERKKILNVRSNVRFLEYVFFGSFFLGILLANVSGTDRLKEFGIFNTYYLEQLQYVKIQTADLFSYIFRCRMSVFVLLIAAGLTRFWKQLYLLFVIWSGGAFGFLCVSGIVNLGPKAILLTIGSLLPQYLFYVPQVVLMLVVTERIWEKRTSSITGQRGCLMAGRIMTMILVIFLLISGMLSETFLNPVLLRKILRLF